MDKPDSDDDEPIGSLPIDCPCSTSETITSTTDGNVHPVLATFVIGPKPARGGELHSTDAIVPMSTDCSSKPTNIVLPMALPLNSLPANVPLMEDSVSSTTGKRSHAVSTKQEIEYNNDNGVSTETSVKKLKMDQVPYPPSVATTEVSN